MPRIKPADLARMASLARLALAEDEISSMTRDLENILGYVASLEGLETEGVEPTAHGFELATPLRPDRPVAPMDPELAVANAPARQGTAFLVPKVLEEEG
jgi:aspartyl-tRNA(Asn)/glutamyl-tRNA(Gln) amidotransferase subunit C